MSLTVKEDDEQKGLDRRFVGVAMGSLEDVDSVGSDFVERGRDVEEPFFADVHRLED